MKRIQLFLVGVFLAVGSLCAQDVDWRSGVAKIKELIKTNPAQASEEAQQLIKKNKKTMELYAAIGTAYLDAGKIDEAQTYAALGRKVSSKSAPVLVLEGDIAVVQKNGGLASQKYEEAIYFDPKYGEAYLKYADIYKGASPALAVEKLEQLRLLDPTNVLVDKKLAEVYYLKNDINNAVDAYGRFVTSGQAKEEDLVKYAFVLFLKHDFEKSLEIANMGLQKNPRHAAFNRLAMYNYTDMKRYEEAFKAADSFFNSSDKADYSYLDYMYYGHLLAELKKYDEAVVQYEKAMQLDPTKTDLLKEISNAYEQKNDYKNAIDAYKRYYASLETEKQTPDLKFQLGKLYYGAGTLPDSLGVSKEEREQALKAGDAIFEEIAKLSPDSYLGNFWRARTNSALDPETTQGLAKPYYEEVAKLIESKNDPRYNGVLIECYRYLGYYYLVAEKMADSKVYWNKILAIDPENATAKKALEGIK